MSSYFQKALDSKSQMRSQLATLPIVEKMRLLDAMRARALELRSAIETDGGLGALHEDIAPYKNREPRLDG